MVPKEELKYDEIVKAYERIAACYKITDVILSGGEPLVRDDILQIIKYLNEKGVSLDLCTNATLIDDSTASCLSQYLSEISVSLNKISGDDNNEKIISGIKCLVNAGVDVHIICTVTRDNYKCLNEVADTVEKLGVHSLTYLGLVESRIHNTSDINSVVLTKEELSLAQNIISICRRNCSNLIINTKRIFEKKREEGCQAGDKILGITADGKLCPCILHQDEFYIDLLDDTNDIKNLKFPKYHACIK